MLEAKRLKVPPEQWQYFGKIGAKIDVPDPADKILKGLDP
jgi:hypothetical protein